MADKSKDTDRKQAFRDVFLTPNRYRLDDRFVIRDGGKHPVAVLVPGGGYFTVCSFIEGVPIARKLNEKGISAYIVYYRVRKKAKFPAPVDDLARAVREILDRAGTDGLETDGYSVWGASAGGHLTACFGTDAMGYGKYGLPRPGALILTYPVISMMPELTHMGSHDNLLGKAPGKEMETFTSVDLQVTENYPPTFVWCGGADELVPVDNTRRMADALEAHGVPCHSEIIPGIGHGVGPGTGTAAEGWLDRAVGFWAEQTGIAQ